MRRVALFLVLLLSCAPFAVSGERVFVVDELLDGVWLFRVPAGSPSHTNSLVIEMDRGLMVVESQPSPRAARDLLAAIGEVSPLPVRYLVLSHPHVESTGGASEFPASALVIASATTRDALADENVDLSSDMPERSGDPDSWVAPPRVAPELLISTSVAFDEGRYRIDLAAVPYGHYPGTLILSISEKSLYYIGAMATSDRNPYVDAEHANIGRWANWVNGLLFSRPEKIVLLRGESIDSDGLRAFRDGLSWLASRIEFAAIERIPVEEMADFVIGSDGFEKYFDVDAKPFFGRTVVQRAVDHRVKD